MTAQLEMKIREATDMLRHAAAQARFETAMLKLARLLKHNPYWYLQPRLPAGVPGGGRWAATGASMGRILVILGREAAKKVAKYAEKIRKRLQGTPNPWEVDDVFPDLEEFDETGRIAAPTPRRPETELMCFGSFAQFKRYFGSAGAGREWHHIVEQRLADNGTFPRYMIHCTDKIISLPKEVHLRINEEMGSKSYEYGVSHLRDEVGKWSYREQYNYGIEMIKRSFKKEGYDLGIRTD